MGLIGAGFGIAALLLLIAAGAWLELRRMRKELDMWTRHRFDETNP